MRRPSKKSGLKKASIYKNVSRKNGGEAYGFKCDVSDRAEVYDVAKKAAKLAGDVTILINNAGIVGGKSFLEADDAMVQKTFEVNAMAHLWTTKAFLPKMIEKNHGHIGKFLSKFLIANCHKVSIASSAGYFAAPKMVDYCASKAAAAHFADVKYKKHNFLIKKLFLVSLSRALQSKQRCQCHVGVPLRHRHWNV